MLEVQDLKKSFKDKPVLQGVSFKLEEGHLHALIGPSCAGKSVLLKILGRVTKATSGIIREPGVGNDQIGLMFQEGALFDSLTVFDNVAFPLTSGNVPVSRLSLAERRRIHPQVEEILAEVGLTRAAFKFPSQISGGMRRRASLARALVGRPKLLLLDDPTSGLDPVASSIIMNLIVKFHKNYRPTTVVVSQDLRRLLPNAEWIFGLFRGRTLFSGTLSDLIESSQQELRRFVSCRYELDAAAIIPDARDTISP